MIVILIAAFFCVLNICLWCTFFLKFRKLFSTEDIVASTRDQVERLISDMNNNTARDINLIEDRIKQLKAVVAEADKHIEVARREIESQNAALSYKQKIDSVVQNRPVSSQKVASQNLVAQQYLKNKDISVGLQGSNRYELTDQGSKQVQQVPQPQGDLFAQAELESKQQIVSPSGTTFTVESDGSSYAQVPVIGGNVSYTDEPIVPAKKFPEMVHDLYLAGHSVEEIARELNRSTTEVQMSLEMGGF